MYLFTVLPTPVAQTCSLLYRRVALCQTLGNHAAWDRFEAAPITNRRYGAIRQIENLRYRKQIRGNAATLGYQSNESSNLNEVVAVCARVGIATTALRLRYLLDGDPR